MHRTIDNLKQLIDNYLTKCDLHSTNPPWEIAKSQLGGFGVFATRPIEIGEVIFRDHPVILGPRAALTCPQTCVGCYTKTADLKRCERNCGLFLCGTACQNSHSHQKECKIIRQWQTQPIEDELSLKLYKVLSPIRSLLLSEEDKDVVKCLKAHRSDQHGFEVDVMKNTLKLNVKEDEEAFMRFVCSVMDSNAFEVIVGNETNQSSVRGLYPLGSLANHSCTPNSMHVFDEHQHMIVRAAVFIPKGQEIFHSYSRSTWGTPTRRFHLNRTKHFLCKCERCEDPTEFGSYMGAILCKICKGNVIPINALIANAKWKCEACGQTVNPKDVAAVSSILGSALNSFSSEDLPYMLKFLQNKLPDLVPKTNETIVELKYKIIWILGYQNGYEWTKLPQDLLSIKEQFCRDLLELLETLRLGQCKMRGLLLYELYCVVKEKRNREEKLESISKNYETESRNLLEEAADILMFDISAPEEIKRTWPKQ